MNVSVFLSFVVWFVIVGVDVVVVVVAVSDTFTFYPGWTSSDRLAFDFKALNEPPSVCVLYLACAGRPKIRHELHGNRVY